MYMCETWALLPVPPPSLQGVPPPISCEQGCPLLHRVYCWLPVRLTSVRKEKIHPLSDVGQDIQKQMLPSRWLFLNPPEQIMAIAGWDWGSHAFCVTWHSYCSYRWNLGKGITFESDVSHVGFYEKEITIIQMLPTYWEGAGVRTIQTAILESQIKYSLRLG